MKNKSTRLSHKVKTKVKVNQRLRYVAAAGALAFGVFVITLMYDSMINSRKSIAGADMLTTQALPEYKWRKQITINTDAWQGDATLYNFPVMVSIVDEDLKSVNHGGKVVSSTGNDIRFTASDGISQLDFDMEKYNPETGECVVWVRMDSLSKTAEPNIYMYFSNKNAVNASTSETWNKNYKAVWHLRGIMNNKLPHANQTAAVTPRQSESKEVYVASEKNASQFVCLNTKDDVDIASDISVSAWVYLTNNKKEQVILSNVGEKGGYRLVVNKKKLDFQTFDSPTNYVSAEKQENGVELNKGEWIHVVASFDEQNNELITYVNGKKDKTIITEKVFSHANAPLQIGREPLNKQYYFEGWIDEVRVASTVLSPEWIAAEYANQAFPKNFMTISPSEEVIQVMSMSLLTFEGERFANEVRLNWLTVNEEDNEAFIVERSTDGENFEEIGHKPGAGNSFEVLNYNFTDEHPEAGINYYRVKLLNSMGAQSFSNITPVKFIEETTTINVGQPTPNPFNANFMVSYSTTQSGPVTLKLANLHGEVVFEGETFAEKDRKEEFMFEDKENLRPGVYFLTLVQNDESKMVKLIKRI
jgi:hypothetical protein